MQDNFLSNILSYYHKSTKYNFKHQITELFENLKCGLFQKSS